MGGWVTWMTLAQSIDASSILNRIFAVKIEGREGIGGDKGSSRGLAWKDWQVGPADSDWLGGISCLS